MRLVGVAATVVFYSLIVFFGIVLLAAVQLRSSGGAAFDTWRLNYESIRIRGDSLRDALKQAIEKLRGDANSQRLNELCLRLYDDSGLPKGKLVDAQTAEEVLEARKKRLSWEIPGMSFDTSCLVKGYAMLRNDAKYFAGMIAEDEVEIQDLKKALSSQTDQHGELIKGHQDFLAIREMAALWFQRPFIVAPYDLLVLVLVMFMGALGGMVRLLRDYGAADHPNPTAGEYLLIPLIGAVVAIGGYVLAKTGLLLLSSARGESSLSPFMISLVGIVSGLLAKEVIDTIAARGRKMLERTDEARRAEAAKAEVSAAP